MDDVVTAAALWALERPGLVGWGLAGLVAFSYLWGLVAGRMTRDEADGLRTAAVLQLAETGSLDLDQRSVDACDDGAAIEAGDGWQLARMALLSDGRWHHDYPPLTDELGDEAWCCLDAGLIEQAGGLVSITDAGRAELRLHRYPRPTRAQRLRWALVAPLHRHREDKHEAEELRRHSAQQHNRAVIEAMLTATPAPGRAPVEPGERACSRCCAGPGTTHAQWCHNLMAAGVA